MQYIQKLLKMPWFSNAAILFGNSFPCNEKKINVFFSIRDPILKLYVLCIAIWLWKLMMELNTFKWVLLRGRDEEINLNIKLRMKMNIGNIWPNIILIKCNSFYALPSIICSYFPTSLFWVFCEYLRNVQVQMAGIDFWIFN